MSGRRKTKIETAQPQVEKQVEEKFTKKSELRKVTAKINTRLPDGTFVREGETIEVSKDFVERLVREKDNSFIISS